MSASEHYGQTLINGAPGHCCGHNVMEAASLAATIAVKTAMESLHIQGTIKIFGSPAEENVISRPYMVRQDLFDYGNYTSE